MSQLVPLVFALPLVAAAALLVAGAFVAPRVTLAVAIAAEACATALGLALLFRAWGHGLVYWFGGWQPRAGGFPVGIGFVCDGSAAALVVFTSLLTTAALVFSWRYMEDSGHLYHALMLLFGGAMAAFVLSGDLFNMFVWFELMGVAAFALTAYSTEASSLQGAFTFAVTNTIGAMLVLSGIGLLYARTGSLNLAEIGVRLARDGRHDGLVIVAFTLIVGGFLIKAAVVPFHFWLADAYAIAPVPVCLLLAGAMSDLGLYAVARIYWASFGGVLDPSHQALRDVLLGLGCATALVGGVMAGLQRHLKRLLAYATIADIGCFLIGIALLAPDGLAGTGMYLLAHGLAKGSLFLVVGTLLARHGSVDELTLHGRGRLLPWSGLTWLVACVALAAPPFVGTWTGHALIGDTATALGYWWVPAVIAAVTVLSTGPLLRGGARVFLGLGPRDDPLLTREPEDSAAAERDVGSAAVMRIVAAILALGSLVVACTPLAAKALEAAHEFVATNAYRALALGHRGLPSPPPRHWVTTDAGVVWGVLTFVGSFAFAAAMLFRPAVVEVSLGRILRPVRAAHSGHIGDYVAWLTFGIAVIGGLFAVTLR